ncbi:Hypothetical protein VS_II1267 [Vibrio atlanticus]|uniref:Uncharacterized protein n=1 Tax=Vibrio atlanticus (strain LGP32) TaxID=575788 RepID=B7VT14_VIBA3|nr:Hypothetical protein VS_II1267 [Vibrio atlanticus]
MSDNVRLRDTRKKSTHSMSDMAIYRMRNDPGTIAAKSKTRIKPGMASIIFTLNEKILSHHPCFQPAITPIDVPNNAAVVILINAMESEVVMAWLNLAKLLRPKWSLPKGSSTEGVVNARSKFCLAISP